MKKTDLATFQRELLETGGYRTPAERLGKRRAPGAWTTFRFALSVAKVFPMSALTDIFNGLTIERWREFCFSSLTIAERFGMPVTVEGLADRAAHSGPVMYLSNHLSTYETAALPAILHAYGPLALVAKESLCHLPMLRHATRICGLIGLGRKNPKEDLLKLYDRGGKALADGSSMLIFPQGTRDDVFSRKRFSSIGAKLAERAGVPIVPIAVDSRCLPTRKSGLLKALFKDFGPVDTARDVRIAAGPVIPCGKAREMHEQCFDWIAGKLESWNMPVERN